MGEALGEELTITPHSQSPCATGGGNRAGKNGGKEGWKVLLMFYFTYHYPAQILVIINAIVISNSSLFSL